VFVVCTFFTGFSPSNLMRHNLHLRFELTRTAQHHAPQLRYSVYPATPTDWHVLPYLPCGSSQRLPNQPMSLP
jgi:hypothetical protein